MARPKTKTELLTMKVSPDEKAQWKQKADAAGVPLSTLIRSAIDGIELPDRPLRRPAPKSNIDPVLIRHLAAIGNNLNQIARKVNREGCINGAAILAALAAIEAQMERLSAH